MPISDNKKIEILSNLVIRAGIYFDLFYVHESKKYREEYLNEMMKGDYNNLLEMFQEQFGSFVELEGLDNE